MHYSIFKVLAGLSQELRCKFDSQQLSDQASSITHIRFPSTCCMQCCMQCSCRRAFKTECFINKSVFYASILWSNWHLMNHLLCERHSAEGHESSLMFSQRAYACHYNSTGSCIYTDFVIKKSQHVYYLMIRTGPF